jgi:isocitrate lyase
MALQRREWADGDSIPTRSHHLYTGVPYHQHVGQQFGTSRFGADVDQHLEVSKVV